MLEYEREQLNNRDSEYISIGITENGQRLSAFNIPWEQTAHAFNMKIPDVFLSPEDLKDEKLMEQIRSFHVVGCYVLTPIDDYSFIAGLPELFDIYLANATKLGDLSFLSGLGEWSMLHISGAHLQDLNAIAESAKIQRFFPVYCFSFAGCKIEDISALNAVPRISELIIVGEDDETERRRWRAINAGTFRYYKIQE